MKDFFKIVGLFVSILAGFCVAKVICEILESSGKKYFEVDKGF